MSQTADSRQTDRQTDRQTERQTYQHLLFYPLFQVKTFTHYNYCITRHGKCSRMPLHVIFCFNFPWSRTPFATIFGMTIRRSASGCIMRFPPYQWRHTVESSGCNSVATNCNNVKSIKIEKYYSDIENKCILPLQLQVHPF